MSLENSKIIVTGAASGIGSETAKTLNAQGATVIGVDLNEPQNDVDQYIKTDLSDPASIEEALGSVPGGIDALCNIMNCVSPGPIETPILPDFLETLGERAEEDMKIMDRPGRPEDIAPVIAFLCNSGSGWIRGANIPCDGGMNQHLLCNMHGHV